MKKTTVIICAGIILYASSCFSKEDSKTGNKEKTTLNSSASPKTDTVKRGEYLVTIMGCGDCHSPKKFTAQGPVPDMDRFLSGYNSLQPVPSFNTKVMVNDHVVMFNSDNTAAAGPWGISFAANITSDQTGIGSWSYENFKTALTKGKFKGLENARDLLPPMPWPNYRNIRDEDLRAIFLYLKSLKPISNRVPDAIPPAATKM